MELVMWYWNLYVNPSNAETTFIQSTRCKDFWKPSKPCNVGIYWRALAEYSQMSTYVPVFQTFFRFLHHFVLAKLATSSMASMVAWTPCNTNRLYCSPQLQYKQFVLHTWQYKRFVLWSWQYKQFVLQVNYNTNSLYCKPTTIQTVCIVNDNTNRLYCGW